MVTFGGTADLLEVLWTLSALPGLWLWMLNRRAAVRSRKAIEQLGYANGRLSWARFSVLLTTVFVVVEATFVMVGGVTLMRPSFDTTPGTVNWARPAFAIGLIGASALISFVAWRWRAVDTELVAAYRQHRIQAADRELP